MDLIDRSKAVRELHEVYDDKQYKCVYEDGETLANEVENILASLPQENQWISCSERLPNNTIPVLVCVRSVMNITTTRTAWFNTVKKVWIVHHKDNEVIGEVIAWQPLPEPYKESEEND